MQKEENIITLNSKKELWINIVLAVCFFIGIFIFFRYVHPVVPWDGDDWSTMIAASDYGIPVAGEYRQIMPNMLGAVMGYIAAFIIYPLSGDYINAIVTSNSLILSVSILISVIMIYRLLRGGLKAKHTHALLGVIFFVSIGFLMFHVVDSSTYLYWQYNSCTVYYYSVPSYIASAYIILLIVNESLNEIDKQSPIKYGLILAAAYILIFSFVPAATMVVATAFWYLIDKLIKTKSIVQTVKNSGLYVATLVFYCIVLYAEFGRTFGTGYLKSNGNMFDALKLSFKTIIGSFLQMHPIMQVICVIVVALALITVLSKRAAKEITDYDLRYGKLLIVISRVLLIVFMYFVLFGAISFSHINCGFMRIDSLYVFYFLVILLIAVCAVYVLENSKNMVIVMPLLIGIMLYPIITPKNTYSGSIYTDSSAKQRYEIMSAIVKEAQRQDEEGLINVKAHIPYAIYGGSIEYVLYMHNIIGQRGLIEVIYDPNAPFYIEGAQ